MRKFLTRPLSKVVLAWGASSAIDHVVDVQHLKKDYRGNCCVLRTERGHMALQSYSTIVEIIFNFYNPNLTRVDVPLGYYSHTTARQMRMFGSIYGELATELCLAGGSIQRKARTELMNTSAKTIPSTRKLG